MCLGVFSMISLAVACSTDSPPPTPEVPAPQEAAPEAGGAVVVVLGDSITAGLGLPVDQAFPALTEGLLAEDGLKVEVRNAGVSGDTSTAGAARVDWLLRQEPDLLVVELGGNDLLRGQPIETSKARLLEICAAAVGAGSDVLLLGVTAPGSVGPDHKARFDAIYPEVAAECGATLLPGFLEPLMGRPELLQADGLHPTAAGQRVLAERLAPAVRAALATRGEG